VRLHLGLCLLHRLGTVAGRTERLVGANPELQSPLNTMTINMIHHRRRFGAVSAVRVSLEELIAELLPPLGLVQFLTFFQLRVVNGQSSHSCLNRVGDQGNLSIALA
jgi:hypothetical protein